MEYEKRRHYALRISEDDLEKINLWASKNDFQITWAIRRAVKDFIKNYVEKGIAPESEVVNPGCIKNKIN